MNRKIVVLCLGSEAVSNIEDVYIFTSWDNPIIGFMNIDLLFITDIFGKNKALALEAARSAKSSRILTAGIYNTVPDPEDMQKFRDVSDAVIMTSDPSSVIKAVSELITRSGFVNLDIDDIAEILRNTGTVCTGKGYAEGENRAERAALEAMKMCGDVRNAKSVLINITIGEKAALGEMCDAAQIIQDTADHDAQVIWGHVIDENMQDGFAVTMIAGMNDNGYRNYLELLDGESWSEDLLLNGPAAEHIFRLGSYDEFFSTVLIHGTPESVRLILSVSDPKTLERRGLFPYYILCGIITRDKNAEILRMLFNAGISIDRDYAGYMTLRDISPEVMRAFIDYGWNVNSADLNGFTALMNAAFDASPEKVRILIEAGAYVNTRDIDGRTALMFACENGSRALEIIRLLIQHGADAAAIDTKGRTAIDIVLSCHEDDTIRREIIPMLIMAGADAGTLNIHHERSRNRKYINPLTKAVSEYDDETVKTLLASGLPENFNTGSLWLAFRINLFPEDVEMKAKLDAGAEILRLLRNAGVNVPVTAPQGRELTYITGKSRIILTSYPDGEIPDDGFNAMCCAYSPEALRQVIMSGADVKKLGGQALKIIAGNYRDYYNPAAMIDILLNYGASYWTLEDTWLKKYLSSHYNRICLNDITEAEIILTAMEHSGDKTKRFSNFHILEPSEAVKVHFLSHMWEILENVYNHDMNRNLILASCYGDIERIGRALQAGADVNYSTWLGYTPLMYASVFNHPKAVKYLLKNGASAAAKSKMNQTAPDIVSAFDSDYYGVMVELSKALRK